MAMTELNMSLMNIRPIMHTVRALFLVLLLVVILPGCVHSTSTSSVDVHGPLPPPPSETLRSELGAMWVTSILAQPEVQFVITPAAGGWFGFGRGGGGGAMIGCAILGWPVLIPTPPTVILGVMGCAGGATVGALSGGIYGAVAAEPEKSIQTVMASVRDALANAHTQERVQDRVRDLVKRRTTVVMASEENAASVRLETGVLSIQLDGLHPSAYMTGSVGVINPSLRLVVTAQARLLNTQSKQELYAARFQYWGPKMTVPEWAAHEAQPVRQEIDRATAALAEQIVDALFLLYRVP